MLAKVNWSGVRSECRARRMLGGVGVAAAALLVPLFLSFVVLPALAAAPVADTAAAPPLRRGVALSNWFTDSQRQPLTARDFRQIKDAGFDYVRVPINPELLGFSLFDAQGGRVLFDFETLDKAVDAARDIGLTTVLDMQPSETVASQVEQDPRAARALVNLWARVADHYKLYPTALIGFELLDAPGYRDNSGAYHTLMAEIVAATRQAMPGVAIILDLPGGSSLDSFDGFDPIAEANLIYAFHFQEPYLFTHQGLKGSAARGHAIRNFYNLPYPSTSVDPGANYAPGAADPIEARKDLSDYVAANWDAAKIAARVKIAADWASANQQRVICSEFGVVRKSARPDARYRWIADTRKALDAAGIGWALWDYTDQFGITEFKGDTVVEPADGSIHLADPEQGSRVIEAEARQALFQ